MRKKVILIPFTLICLITIVQSCAKLEPKAPKADEVMDAPLDGLTYAQNKLFIAGAEEFDEAYTSETGLGPVFVANSCGSCHAGDNRGHFFTILTRFGQTDSTENKFMQFGAPQIQNRAIIGHQPEQLPSGATFSNFIAPIAAGVGFIELVSDADILAMADPTDADGDGISGVPNWNTIPSWVIPFPNAVTQGGRYICRFGRKGSTYNLHQQTVGAFNQDMGVTSTFISQNPFNYLEGLNSIPTGEPEISDQGVNATVFYLQVLQTPIQRNQNDVAVQSGKQLFINIGCEGCHKQTLKTGYSPVEQLSYKEFHPYTDLLLHDMGAGLDDNYTEGSAKTSEWRTTPLWGLGLAQNSQGGNKFLMHDGRANSIEEAIRLHGGEAHSSRDKFTTLPQSDKNAVIKFLESL
jgi:CxxC motif-containing protein (DUF1111 family)